MEVPGVARNYTAHLFGMQAKCYLRDVAETRVRTTMAQQPLCGIRAAGWQKVRLKFLYTAKPPESKVFKGDRASDARVIYFQLSAAPRTLHTRHSPVQWPLFPACRRLL